MTTRKPLSARRIAALATGGFEQREQPAPKRLPEEVGATVDLIAPGGASQLRDWDGGNWGNSVDVDRRLTMSKRKVTTRWSCSVA